MEVAQVNAAQLDEALSQLQDAAGRAEQSASEARQSADQASSEASTAEDYAQNLAVAIDNLRGVLRTGPAHDQDVQAALDEALLVL